MGSNGNSENVPFSGVSRGGSTRFWGTTVSGHSVSTSGSARSPLNRSDVAMTPTPSSDNTFLRLNDDAGSQTAAGTTGYHMVSLNPNPPESFYTDSSPMAITNVGSFSTAVSPSAVTSSAADDASKKIRKPYTITKSRESWSEPEHDKFLEALQLFDRDWKKIEAFIGSKTVIQIRSHAQKYFLKVQKSGTNEHLPPPRPKRKAAHPYPQKAPKNVPAVSQLTSSFQASPALSEPEFIRGTNPSTLLTNSVSDAAVCSRTHNSTDFGTLSRMAIDDRVSGGQPTASNCCSSYESALKTRPASEVNEQRIHGLQLRVLPDFAQVYGFIGSVFDPHTSGHLQKLKKMDPIDVETVLLLMRNLSINLTSPDFEDHRRLLSTYEAESDNENSDDVIDALLDCQPEQVGQPGT